MWRWYLVDADAPACVADWLRRYYLRYSGPAGLVEQDDMENWDYATEASRGASPGATRTTTSWAWAAADPSTLRGAVESELLHDRGERPQLLPPLGSRFGPAPWTELMAGT